MHTLPLAASLLIATSVSALAPALPTYTFSFDEPAVELSLVEPSGFKLRENAPLDLIFDQRYEKHALIACHCFADKTFDLQQISDIQDFTDWMYEQILPPALRYDESLIANAHDAIRSFTIVNEHGENLYYYTHLARFEDDVIFAVVSTSAKSLDAAINTYEMFYYNMALKSDRSKEETNHGPTTLEARLEQPLPLISAEPDYQDCEESRKPAFVTPAAAPILPAIFEPATPTEKVPVDQVLAQEPSHDLPLMEEDDAI